MKLLGIPSSFKALLAISALAVSVVCAPLAVAEKYASIVIDADTQEVLHARNADGRRRANPRLLGQARQAGRAHWDRWHPAATDRTLECVRNAPGSD